MRKIHTMLLFFNMFRLHIVCGVVEFRGWMWVLPIVETLSEGKSDEKISLVRIVGGCDDRMWTRLVADSESWRSMRKQLRTRRNRTPSRHASRRGLHHMRYQRIVRIV